MLARMAVAHIAAVAAVIISGRPFLPRSDVCSLVFLPLISTTPGRRKVSHPGI